SSTQSSNGAPTRSSRAEFWNFFTTMQRHVERSQRKQRRIDRRSATAFNVFKLIEPDENRLSDIIADLLEPNGTHGQGELFLRLLCEQLGPRCTIKLSKSPTVQREAPTFGILKFRRRIDILVDTDDLIAIENKVNSPEQADQVKDY